MSELAGRVALVTGAARNIGRAIALQLAEAGAAVVVNARAAKGEIDAVAAEINGKDGQALAILADITDRSAVDRMMDEARRRFGRLDILVNNAGLRAENPLERVSAAEWRQVLAVCLDGAFNCAQSCLADLRQSDAGRIVNIGGLTGHTGARHRVHVVTAKAGLAGFTRALAHELAADRITVNCVAPGLIEWAKNAPLPDHRLKSNKTLVGGLGSAEDVAAMVRHLCGPAGRFITGQTIHVNGGAFLG